MWLEFLVGALLGGAGVGLLVWAIEWTVNAKDMEGY